MAQLSRDPSEQRDTAPAGMPTETRRTDMFAARRIWYVILGMLVVMTIVAALINSYWDSGQPSVDPAPAEEAVPRDPGH